MPLQLCTVLLYGVRRGAHFVLISVVMGNFRKLSQFALPPHGRHPGDMPVDVGHPYHPVDPRQGVVDRGARGAGTVQYGARPVAVSDKLRQARDRGSSSTREFSQFKQELVYLRGGNHENW